MAQYFKELRNRFFLWIITWSSIFFMTYLYKEIIFFAIIQSAILLDKDSIFSSYLIFTNAGEVFSIYLQLSTFISFQVGVLYFIYHAFIFFSPALFFQEYTNVIFILKTILIVWLISLLSLNYVLIPLTWKFFMSFQNFGNSDFLPLHFEAKISEYFTFYTSLYYLCVFYFQFFSVIFLFTNRKGITIKSIKKYRKFYYCFFLLFSTLITPPDVLSQILVSCITIGIYESLNFLFFLSFRLRN